MRKSTYAAILILFIFSCKAPEVTPVITNIQFSMEASRTSAQQGDYVTFSITREGDFKDLETDTYVTFYLSTDNVYSTEDILISSEQTANFTSDAKTVDLSVQITGAYIQSKTYYMVAKIVAATASTSVRYCYLPLSVTVPETGVSFLGMNLSTSSFSYSYSYEAVQVDSQFYESASIYFALSYIGSIPYASSYSSSSYVSYTLYLSKDNVYNSSSDSELSNDSFEVGTQLSTGTTTGSFQLSSSTAPAGTYYIIATGSYSNNGSTIYLPTISKKITIKKYVDMISITGMSIPSTSFSRNESFPCVVTITNGNLTSQYLNLNTYLSGDQTYENSTADINIGSSYITVEPGKNVITVLSTVNNYTNYGTYYLLAYSSYSISSYYGTYLTSNFTGPIVQIVAPNASVSGVRLDSALYHVDQGSSFNCNITTVSDFNSSSSSESMDGEIFISLDNTWSADDISLGERSLYYQNASYTASFNCVVPGSVSNGSYYIIVRYQKPGFTDHTTIASTNQLVVQSASAVLFRNTQNTNYSTLYLFVDDVYVIALDCYSSMSSPTCAAFVGASCSNYYGTYFYYKFFGNDGLHTFKLRTTNNLATGAALFAGNFNASSSGCSATDVD